MMALKAHTIIYIFIVVICCIVIALLAIKHKKAEIIYRVAMQNEVLQ